MLLVNTPDAVRSKKKNASDAVLSYSARDVFCYNKNAYI